MIHMVCYGVKAKIPKNSSGYLVLFRKKLIEMALQKNIECVVEFLHGRIVVFSDSEEIVEMILKIDRVMDVFPIKIYESEEELLDHISKMLNGCKTFAVRSNRKETEIKLGNIITEMMGIGVNLTSPQCEITVEKRGKYYILHI